MKSKIEVREYAVGKAVELIGQGSPAKDVVAKAKEIEAYIAEGIELPDTVSDIETMGTLLGAALEKVAPEPAKK